MTTHQHTPTPEQQDALDLFATGENLAIEAGAGTGKTSTLLLLAHSTKRRGQYLAFNRSIVKEAGEKFPGTVNASTAHSLAFRAVGHRFEHRIRNSTRLRSIDIANRLGIDAIKVRAFDGQEKLLSQTFLAGIAMRGVTKFCQSADAEPTWQHVPYIEGLDPVGPDGRKRMVNRDVARHLEKPLRKAWSDLQSTEGGLPYKHDAYLKLWQMSEPRIGADFILFDECQDANPVMAAVVFAQEHAQLVFVGDSQQQIYAFTGAVNSLARIRETGCATTFLTQSFRFGPQIADVANSVLGRIEGAELRLTGTSKIGSVVAPIDEADAVLTRTNAAAVRYVLEGMREGKRVALVGGAETIIRFARAAKQLMRDERTDHPELACFESWSEVQEYVDEDEQGGELRLMVSLIDEFSVETILDALGGVTAEKDADLVVSTAHKSKGREWDSVKLAGDFNDQPNIDEKRLLYVAATRARRELDISAVKFLADGWEPKEHYAAPVATTAAQARAHVSSVEVVEAPESEHVGTVGEMLDLTLTVERVRGLTTRFGWTHLTGFVDADGNHFKAFLDDELDEGTTYTLRAKVKEHGEYNGAKETTINYVKVIEEVRV
jgi:superfamily I DNA/RNA helicase